MASETESNQQESSKSRQRVLDLTENEPPSAFVRRPHIETPPSDLPLRRERKRGHIAMVLVWLLVAVVAASFTAACLRNVEWVNAGGLSVPDVKEILNIIFPPIIALVGTVTGFYFGDKADVPGSASSDVLPRREKDRGSDIDKPPG